jgi:hypothetical protein
MGRIAMISPRPSAPADHSSAQRSAIAELSDELRALRKARSIAHRLAGTTATIILLVPHVGSPWAMFESRIGEVGWGVSVAVVTVWLAARLPAARGAQGS